MKEITVCGEGWVYVIPLSVYFDATFVFVRARHVSFTPIIHVQVTMFYGNYRLGTVAHTSLVFPPVDEIYVPFS